MTDPFIAWSQVMWTGISLILPKTTLQAKISGPGPDRWNASKRSGIPRILNLPQAGGSMRSLTRLQRGWEIPGPFAENITSIPSFWNISKKGSWSISLPLRWKFQMSGHALQRAKFPWWNSWNPWNWQEIDYRMVILRSYSKILQIGLDRIQPGP